MKLLVLCALLCVLALTKADDVSQLEKTCSTGWTKYSGRCFRVVPRSMSWPDAENNCQAMGGHLASVKNREEYFWVQHLINTETHTSPKAWIGGSMRQGDSAWIWSDGTSFTFTFWCSGEPSGWSQHCLQMNYSDNKCWDNVQCHSHRVSVCAKEVLG